MKPKEIAEIAVVLDDMRSAHNVGSAFRTADAAGVSHLYLCGTTPTPVDRFGRPRADIAKVALGAEKTVPWSHAITTALALAALKRKKFFIVAIEQSKHSVDYKKLKLPKGRTDRPVRIAFVFGNEVGGIAPALLARRRLIDAIAEIPMRGQKESLNVSVALGVALFRMLNI